MIYEYEKNMNKYNQYLSSCSAEEIEQERKRLLSKLKRVKYLDQNGKIIKRDITNNREEINRIELRYKMTHNYDRMKRFFRFYNSMRYDKGMELLNKAFIDPRLSLDDENSYLADISSKNIDFINTLNFDGLEKYDIYLKNVFESPMYAPKKLSILAKEESRKVFNKKNRPSIFSDFYLSNSDIEEYGTCICKLKYIDNTFTKINNHDVDEMAK